MNAPGKLFSRAPALPVIGSDDVAVYRRREKLEKVSAYVPEAVRAQILLLARAWSVIDKQHDPKLEEWSSSEATRRLIEASIGSALDELGLDQVTTEADVERVAAEFEKRLKSKK